tara:strand:+ start:768 stop:884 length:117 start_codon:yes stop_codon:yes gene_type:complete
LNSSFRKRAAKNKFSSFYLSFGELLEKVLLEKELITSC